MNGKKELLAAQATELTFLRSALNDVGAYIFTKDINGCYTFANKKVLDLLGVTLDELVGKDDSHFFDLTTSNQISIHDRRVMDQKQVIELEESITIKATGEDRVYWTIKKPVYDDQGEVLGMCGVSTDITDRNRLENKLHQQKQLLDTVLNNIDAYVYMKDNQRVFHYVNNKTANLFGKSIEEIVGRRDTDVLPKEAADHFWELDKKVFVSNKKQAGKETFVDAKGNRFHYWTIKVPLTLENDMQTLIGFSSDITELYQLKEELQVQANTDPLTGLFNRRYFYEQANREFLRSKRQQLPLSILIIDIDLFKTINDSYGHPVGDVVLSSVASNFLSLIREEDILARVGGEEFAILLPNTNLDSAIRMAERIREFQASQTITGKWDGTIAATISIGVSIIHQKDPDFSQLFLRADRALYNAKQQGRNQICCEE